MTTIITEQIGSGNVRWQWIASSADGSHLAAVAYNGYLYTSTDFGVTWPGKIVGQIHASSRDKSAWKFYCIRFLRQRFFAPHGAQSGW